MVLSSRARTSSLDPMDIFHQFLDTTGFANLTVGNLVMMLVGLVFIALAIIKDYEPLLLVPIGFGILIGNIPASDDMQLGVYDSGSVLSYIYFGVSQGIFPPLIFLGIGAMTDFSTMLSNPKLILLGAAAQMGIFLTLIGAMYLGFSPKESAAIGIIGGADGPTAIFLASKLAPSLIGPIAIAAYSYMALVPVIQPPIMKLLTTRKERLIRMKPPRHVTRREKIIFPIAAFLICTMIAPGSLVLVGMLFLGNLLKESTVTERLANSARNAMIDIVTILLGFSVGASTDADNFLTKQSLMIFGLGALSFAVATASGVLFAKFMNLFLTHKINPLIGAAGVSAVPDSARVAQIVGQSEDPHNFLLMHAMAPNVAGVIGSAVAAGVLWSVLAGQ
jgi:sodium ion-translocating decarboxylase beta subunit